MFLSVIVPVYNAEKYLERSVKSILRQGLAEGDFEVLLVNDGSKDQSWQICQQLAEDNPKTIRIFTKANEGLGPTRQYAVERAKGDYITFCDADDYLLDNGYKYLKDHFLADSVDVLSFYSKTVLEEAYAQEISSKEIDGKIVFDGTGREFYHSKCHTFVWNQIFNRTYLQKSGVKFRYLPMVEDVMFNLELAMTNPRMRVVSTNIYRYELHATSLIHNRNKRFLREAIEAYTQLLLRINEFRVLFEKQDHLLGEGLKLYLNSQMVPFMSRILASDYSVSEFSNVRCKLVKAHILPLEKKTKTDKIVSFLFETSSCFKFYQFVYQKIFLKFIFPHLNRRK